MSFFNSGFFWFAEGLLACLAVIGLKLWAEDRKIPMPFWKWLIVAAWLLFVSVSVAFVGTSLGEGETHAAFIGATSACVLAAISGVIVWRLLTVR
jgi:hypothetical protein